MRVPRTFEPRVRSSRPLLAALTVALATAALTTAAASPAGAAPAARPGELVQVRETVVRVAPAVPLPARAWALSYGSTAADGAPTVVSGTLMVPPGPWRGEGERPVIGYAIGTHGLADRCAPSAALANGTEQELGLMQQALQRGWAVVVTDYEGLGAPGPHTYTVALSEGHAVLDAVRAAAAVPGAGLSGSAPVGLWGYSQGGGATAVAAELAARYAPELDVRGAAAGGVPADLEEVFAANLQNRIATGLLVAATTGFDAAYPELGLRERLTPAGQRLYDQVQGDCVGEIVLRGLPFTAAQLSRDPDPLDDAARARLAENGAGAVAPGFPALVYHGGFDELIPVTQGRGLAADWCALGVDVQYTELPGQSHIGGAAVAGPTVTQWLADRFDGEPAPSTCG